MLKEFLVKHQDEILQRCRARVSQRTPGAPAGVEYGIAEFIRQLIAALQIEHSAHPQDNLILVGEPGGAEMRSEIGTLAAVHGKDLLALGLEVEDVVHQYGDVCQVVTTMAQEMGEDIGVDEYRTLNRCLDSAIAHAVTEFSYHRDMSTARESVLSSNARTGEFLQELHKMLGTAGLAFAAARSGSLSVGGATGAVLERTLQQMGKLIDNFSEDLHGVQLAELDVYSVAALIEEVCTTTTPAAQAHGCTLTAPPVDKELGLRGNRDAVFAALINLLQNAFEAAQPEAQVTLAAYASGEHIRIDIMDNCCDAPAEPAEPGRTGSQRSELGLALARRFVAANNGVLTMRELPGAGRMFAVSLPRYAMPS